MSVPAEVHVSAMPQRPLKLRENHDEWRVSAALSHVAAQELASISSIVSIAISLNISASRLRRIFKQKIGVSFGRYVKVVRLRAARKLLQGTHLSIKQVRIEVGLFDHSHFAKDYKKEFGESPSQTRRSSTAVKTTILPTTSLDEDAGQLSKLA